MCAREDIQQKIEYFFKDTTLLRRSLTHKSYANENKSSSHNERMEFLGDAVLNFVVTEHLMTLCPDSQEGDLSKFRAAVVSEPSLATIARKFNLGSFLFLGRGEDMTGGRTKDSLLADSLEALIAAIYLDGGMESCRTFIHRAFNDLIRKVSDASILHDYKTELQELCQVRLKQLPEYRVVSEIGPEHQKRFEVEIFVQHTYYGRGMGKNKKEAEQYAAKEAFAKLTDTACPSTKTKEQ